jgi:hypothetical protein
MRGRSVVALLALVACKRTSEPEQVAAPSPPPPPPPRDAAAADAPDPGPSWYRAVVRAPDGIEAPFFLGVTPHQAIFKSGSHELRDDATFDHRTLAVHLAVYQTAVDATVQPDGALAGTTYGVTWPVVAVPGTTDDFTKIMPSGLTNLDPSGFPLLLFVAGDCRLIALHAGFPATDSEAYAAVTAEIRGDVEKLLASARP